MPKPSKLFVGYRALGFVSNHIPFTLRYIERRKENLVVTAIGRSFHTYGCRNLRLLSVSEPHEDEINALTSDRYLVFTACKNVIYAWRRGTELKHIYKRHQKNVHAMLPFGPHLLSVDEESKLIIWEIKTEAIYLEMDFDNKNFQVTTMMHPNTYMNKILFGSQQGTMQLWNLLTKKLIYTFAGWNSPIRVIEQSTATDVVAIGLDNGNIIIHNLKYDETVMKFYQEWGPVTALTFRTDGPALLTSASVVGHIAVWDLEQKKLHSQIREAHGSEIAGMKFLPNEPLLLTSSSDNTLKMWIFDLPDGSGRLLRFREGHAAPPIKIRFHGSDGLNILSASLDNSLRSFSALGDHLNKSLGKASFNRKMAKRKKVADDPGKMPPIINFASEIAKEKHWDNIAACHHSLGIVTTWNYGLCRMGEHKLLHERFKRQRNVFALCVTITSCGNYVLIGYNTGNVDRYNIQSGMFRGSYGENTAHDGSVRGIATDNINLMTITGGSDKKVKFWRFIDGHYLSTVDVEEGVSHMLLERESSMLAVALDNFHILIVDVEKRTIIRTFVGHGSRITDMAFSPNADWLIAASMDCTIRTWGLSSGRQLDCFLVSSACTSLTFSPTGDFLATTHVDDLGIYLWANCTFHSVVVLQPLPEDYQPSLLELPSVSLEETIKPRPMPDEAEDSNDEDVTMEELEYKSPEQLAENLVTLSSLPHSHWASLFNLDIIKQRNKPKSPPKTVKSAPFFLPTVSGLKPEFVVENDTSTEQKAQSRILFESSQPLNRFGQILMESAETEDYEKVFSELKTMGPSAIELNIRSLSPDGGGSIFLLLTFMGALYERLMSRKDYQISLSYLSVFLKVHEDVISSNKELFDYAKVFQQTRAIYKEELQPKFGRCISVLNYIRGSVL